MLITLILCLLLNVAQASPHDRLRQKKQQLNRVIKNIEKVNALISKTQTSRAQILVQLKSIEHDIADYALAIERLDRRIKQAMKEEAALKEELLVLENKLSTHQHYLSQHVLASYQLGRDDALKLLLNQENSRRIARLLHYYAMISKARITLIKKIENLTSAITAQHQEIKSRRMLALNLKTRKALAHKRLKQRFKARQKIVSRLNRNLKSAKNRLKYLHDNRASLESLIAKLGHTTPPTTYDNIRNVRSQLRWPVVGKTRAEANNGLLIKAKGGESVHAVFPGKVIFANWLRGYGLLMIVDHGHDYLSLYAHCQNLYKKTGDKVLAGEAIASVGSSGGERQNSLYFEIRYKGQAINPLAWLSKRKTRFS